MLATRFTRATGDCFLRELERFRVLFFRVDVFRVDFLRLDAERLVFFRLDFRLELRRVRPLFAVDFRALAPRFFRAEPFERDDRFEAFRPDFLRDDFLRVAIGQLLVRRVCTVQRKFHAQCVSAVHCIGIVRTVTHDASCYCTIDHRHRADAVGRVVHARILQPFARAAILRSTSRRVNSRVHHPSRHHTAMRDVRAACARRPRC